MELCPANRFRLSCHWICIPYSFEKKFSKNNNGVRGVDKMNILKILKKDSKIALRDLLIIYIIVIPLVMAAAIRVFSPGISDSTVKIAMLESESRETIDYMKEIAQVELFENKNDLEKRVLKRDDVPALILKDGKTQIITEGNEDHQTIESVKTVAALYEVGSVPEDTTAKIYNFGKTVPQVRTMLTNIFDPAHHHAFGNDHCTFCS